MQRNNKITKNSSKARPGQSNNKTKQNKKKNNGSRVLRPQQNLLGLSACVLKYATAISDPWSPEAGGACIPTFPSRPSHKVTAFARAQCVVGTAGVGAILVCPALANSSNCMYISNSTWTGTTAAVTNATGGTFAAVTHNAPYTTAQLSPVSEIISAPVAGRIVSVGVSVQYTGTKLNEGGLIIGLVSPNHENLNTNYPSSTLGAFREAYISVSGSKKHWFTIAGQSSEEVEYPDNRGVYTSTDIINSIYPLSNGQSLDATLSTSVGAAPLLIYVNGVAGNSFQVEYIMHAEYIGQGSSAGVTETHSDANGFQIVNTAAAKVQSMAVARPNVSRPSLMREAIQETLQALKPVANFAMKAAGTPQGQALLYSGAKAVASRAGYLALL